jgi:hypothetical protein
VVFAVLDILEAKVGEISCNYCLLIRIQTLIQCLIYQSEVLVQCLHLSNPSQHKFFSHTHVVHTQEDFQRGLQTMVSRNKRRFIDHDAKFDLDLTYSHPFCIPTFCHCQNYVPYFPFCIAPSLKTFVKSYYISSATEVASYA